MIHSPFFSVVIPLYNKERFIEKTINAVLNQEFTDFEIVIVNDGSTDDSLAMVKRFNDNRIRLYSQENAGVSAARNAAIEKSKGKFIAGLDADDVWKPNHLNNLNKLIALFPEAVMYCTNYQIEKNNNVLIPASFSFDYGIEPLLIDDFFAGMKKFGITHSSSTVFRKQDFDQVGGYDENMPSGQDTDLWIKLGLLGKVAFHPEITMIYRDIDNSSLSSYGLYKSRAVMLDNFKQEEKKNKSLKSFLDLNRFAIAITASLANDTEFRNKIKKDIEYSHLNIKQRVLLSLPAFILRWLYTIQNKLIKKGIYLTSYN